MAYIPKERFIQIAVTSEPISAGLFALDESGQVWNFNFEHHVWVPLARTRGELTEARDAQG